ncbi:MAG: ABC transporter permease [bacterium]|nr:ABC transporter permease [bacterium]
MSSYILRRLLHTIPLMLGITLVAFFIVQLAPGDYFTKLSLNPEINPETISKLKEEFGLDKPLINQYFMWLGRLLRADLGQSIAYHLPVATLVKERLWNTLYLSLVSIILTWLIAIPIGIHCATHQYSFSDKTFSVIAFVGMSLPTFFVAFLFIFAAAYIDWLPTGGMTDYQHDSYAFWGRIWDYLKHLIIPVSVLVATSIAGLLRLMRANMLEVMRLPYVTAARAKGLSERVVIYRHALRNAINPLITIFGYQLSGLLSGAALTEIITRWPGLGRLMLDAVLKQDLFLVMGGLVISSLLLIAGNLAADILLAMSDPRIRYR